MRRVRRGSARHALVQIEDKIPAMTPGEISALISAHLPGCEVAVESEDNTHFNATVVSAAFAGLPHLGRHRLVYEALGTRMGGEIHALSIRAHTPEEWLRLNRAGNGLPRG